jgi:hypothetical protein
VPSKILAEYTGLHRRGQLFCHLYLFIFLYCGLCFRIIRQVCVSVTKVYIVWIFRAEMSQFVKMDHVCPEDLYGMHLQNDGANLPYYMVLHPRRSYYNSSPQWTSQISCRWLYSRMWMRYSSHLQNQNKYNFTYFDIVFHTTWTNWIL